MNVTSLPTSCPDKLPNAVFKSKPEDFQVDELLGFQPDGEGEHAWLNVRKTGHNTDDLIELLAGLFNVQAKDIGYSGLKDKHAVTTQWVSIPVATAGQGLLTEGVIDADKMTQAFAPLQGVEVTQITRNTKKLRSGAHRQNRFVITLRDLVPEDALERRLTQVAEHGFPNYFGHQRFGHDGRNVAQARSMFQGRRKVTRFKRGIYLSAARSCLFNMVLATRVANNTWSEILPGEACMLDGTNSVFPSEVPDDEMKSRNLAFDIHPSGPMVGRGEDLVTSEVAELEKNCLQAEAELITGLERAGLKQERRALRSIAHELQWGLAGQSHTAT